MFKENELYFLSVLDFYKIEITGETFESKEWLKENNYSWDTNKKVWYKIANIVLDEDKEFERRRLKVNQQKVTDYKLFFSTLLNTIKEEEYTSFVSICKIIKILDTRVFMQNNVEKFLSSLLISDKTKCFRLIVWDKIDSKLIKQEKLYKMRIKYSKRYTNELQLYCESIDDICELSETSDLSFTLKTNEDLQQ